MLVSFFWPNCDYRGKEGGWGHPAVDAYAVGFTPEEMAVHRPDDKYNPKDLSPPDMGKAAGRIYCVYAHDLSFSFPIHWYYPIDHMWNGYSPFQSLNPEVEITDLSDLRDLSSSKPNPPSRELCEDAMNRAFDEFDGLDDDAIMRTLAAELPSFAQEFNQRWSEPEEGK